MEPPDSESIGAVPLSGVGSEGPGSEENMQSNDMPPPRPAPNLLHHMESLLSRLLAAPQPQSASNAITKLIRFDPEDKEADIEGWCNMTEIIINSKKLEGAELLLALTHALKGRAATCLTKLQASQLTWTQIKELLMAKFARPMLPQDYFDEVLRFQITAKETASEAAVRLWNIIERIPRMKMDEDMITGFVASVLCQKDNMIRREVHSHNLATRSQLLRILNGISLKRKHDADETHDIDTKKTRYNEQRFTGTCHRCGTPGHRAIDCRKRREDLSADKKHNQAPKVPDKSRPITCFVCGRPGHLASSCPDRKGGSGEAAVKEVNVCERRPTKSTLTTSSGEPVSFLFDSGSACSLVTCSLAEKFPGTSRSDIVYLTGIGRENVECVSQVLSPIVIQGIPLTVLFHIVPDGTISEPVIIGRDILENNVHVQIDNDNIIFSMRKEVNVSDSFSYFDLTMVDTDLQGDDKIALIKILQKYKDYFIEGIPTRRVKTGVLRIDPIDPSKIVQRRPYRLAPAEKEIVKEKVESLLKAGVIRESNSPFASPILLVKKKGQYR